MTNTLISVLLPVPEVLDEEGGRVGGGRVGGRVGKTMGYVGRGGESAW